jgi:hypothetical protein
MNAPSLAAEYVPSYSYGKRENILLGHEPRLPRALLEGRHSNRMVELKGRTYNEEDWLDDEKTEGTVKRGKVEDASKRNQRW